MIELETNIVWTGDCYGSSDAITLKQEKVNRLPHIVGKRSGVAMYSRWNKSGVFDGFEVFQIKVDPKGHQCFGSTCGDDTEKYPTKMSFGRYAWHIMTEARANEVFMKQVDFLTAKMNGVPVVETEDGGEEEIEVAPRPILATGTTALVIPEGEFSAQMFGAANNLPVPGKGYFTLQSLIKSGKVVEVARRSSGPGRPTIFYSKVS